MKKKLFTIFAILTLVLSVGSNAFAATEKPKKPDIELLNVSYDPTRELYAQYNKAFAAYWKLKANQNVTIKQSHGGSGSQARSVIDGLEADVVTLALSYDIDAIQKKGLINDGWEKRFAHNSSPYTSTIVFLVRKGNPKKIKDWDDLVRNDVQVITPNPKTGGGARWNFLAAWGYALKHNNDSEAKAKDFVTKLYKNVPVLDTGARGSTTTFVERGIGDVLITWENEAFLALKEKGSDYQLVTPSYSILAEPSVAVVNKNVEKHGTRDVAKAYLDYLYTEAGQRIVAQNFYRPTNLKIAAEFSSKYVKLELTNIQAFGGWDKAQAKFFADGAIFDDIYN